MQEGLLWEEIEKEKAKQRMLSGGYPVERCPQGSGKGRTRDIIANKINLGAGRTYTRAKIVVMEITII